MWSYLNLRSGSSFLGSLMSAGEEVTYIYEPLYKVSVNGTKIENLEDMEYVRKFLRDLFQCGISFKKRKNQYRISKPARLHKNIETCKTSKARIIKTIRVRYNHLESWIQWSDIKVGMVVSSMVHSICSNITYTQTGLKELR